MSNIIPTTPSFVFGYWRPWKENANMFDSYLDYVKDTSLARYSADTIGSYISQASKEQVQAISQLSNVISKGFNILSGQLSDINENLSFLNKNLDIVIENQRLSNLILEEISELLKIPDIEKERQRCIEMGIKFFLKAQHDVDLYKDALEELLRAETLMKQDYFVLHRIGCIYLYVENFLDPTKALDYFLRAAKYTSVENDPQTITFYNSLIINKDKEKIKKFKKELANLMDYSKSYTNGYGSEEHVIFFNYLQIEHYSFDLYFDNPLIKFWNSEYILDELSFKNDKLIDKLKKTEENLKLYVSSLINSQESLCNIVEFMAFLLKFWGDSDTDYDYDFYSSLQKNKKEIASYAVKIREELIKRQTDIENLIKKYGIIKIENISNINDVKINAFASDSYEKAAFASYILGNFSDAVTYQNKSVKFYPSPQNQFLLSKYLIRNGNIEDGINNLSKIIDIVPEFVSGIFREIDLINEPEVISLLKRKDELLNKKLKNLIEELKIIDSLESDNLIQELVDYQNKSYEAKIEEYRFGLEQIELIRHGILKEKFDIDDFINKIGTDAFLNIEKSKLIAYQKELNEAKNLPVNDMRIVVTKIKNEIDQDRLKIGSNYAGGIVFSLDKSGKHGLICAPKDFSISIWGTEGRIYAENNGFKAGVKNTKKIFESASFHIKKGFFRNEKEHIITAARLCVESNLNGYSDWYLPTKSELQLMHKNLHKIKIGNFKLSTYWSSNEKDYHEAYYLDFDTGTISSDNKGTEKNVRAIRAF